MYVQVWLTSWVRQKKWYVWSLYIEGAQGQTEYGEEAAKLVTDGFASSSWTCFPFARGDFENIAKFIKYTDWLLEFNKQLNEYFSAYR